MICFGCSRVSAPVLIAETELVSRTRCSSLLPRMDLLERSEDTARPLDQAIGAHAGSQPATLPAKLSKCPTPCGELAWCSKLEPTSTPNRRDAAEANLVRLQTQIPQKRGCEQIVSLLARCLVATPVGQSRRLDRKSHFRKKIERKKPSSRPALPLLLPAHRLCSHGAGNKQMTLRRHTHHEVIMRTTAK